MQNDIFRPPARSPQASTSTFTPLGTSNDYFSLRSKKRQRPESSHNDGTTQQTPFIATPSWVRCPTPGGCGSSATVNERYCLAGGYDTPGLLGTSDFDRREQYEYGRRMRRYDETAEDVAQDGGKPDIQQLRGPLARERNGVARTQSSPNGAETQCSSTWTSFAFSLVGRVFNFGSTVIKGFYAGTGKGYDLDQQSSSDSWVHSRPPLVRQRKGSTPVPGSWQDDEFLGDFEQDNPNSPTLAAARPSNKRRQTDRDSWVIVGTPEVTMEMSPKRKSSAAHGPRTSSRPSLASRANSRRSLLPVSRRQSYHVTHDGSPAQAQVQASLPSHTALQNVTNDRQASFAPSRSVNNSRPSSSSGMAQKSTYVSPETAKLLKRQAKQDKAADKAMSSMSKQLEDLIKQGRDALGTKVSIEAGESVGTDDMDDDFVDEEW